MAVFNNPTLLLDSLAAMGNFIEVVDKQGYYVYCSKNCNYDTYSPKEMIGRHVTEAYNLTEEASVLLETLRTGKPKRNVFLRYTSKKTGKEHFWLYDAFPIINKGSVDGAITIYRSIGTLKRIINELNELESHTINSRKTPITGDIKCHYCHKNDFYEFDDIIRSNTNMAQTITLAKRVSKGNSPVLLVGETGTGKELFAQSIHSYSSRRDHPFVAVNCAAIPETLLESILFGVTKGAYTGAVEKKGLFEESSNGTIFLDEIQSLSPEMQAKLLRVLEEKKIRRLGASEQEISINPRIISAMNVDPFQYIEQGKLKPDLFYRIAVVNINIPPLRERGEDILLLANYFIKQINQKFNLSIEKCSEDVLKVFNEYSWPGNVRELQHVIEHAANVMDENETTIQIYDLPIYLNRNLNNHSSKENTNDSITNKKYPIGDYKKIRQEAIDEFNDNFNREFLTQALEEFHGNISKTARAINISRQHLHELINKYNILQ